MSGIKRLMNKVLLRMRALFVHSSLLRCFQTRMIYTCGHLIEGKTKENGQDLCVLFFGSRETLHHIIRLIYSETPQVKILGRMKLKNAISMSKEIPSDIVLAEFEGFLSNTMSKHFLLLPHLTSFMDITPSIEVLISNMRRLRRRLIRTIQETEYTYEYTKSSEKLDFFYNKLYVPHISNQHGASSKIVSKQRAEEIFQKGGLFMVKLGEDYVSGILFAIKGLTIQCGLLGLSSNARELAGQAALFGLIKWGKEKGCTELDYGRTPPFASDGLYLYKRTWGMQVKQLSDIAFGINFCNLSDGVMDFMANNPFVFECSNELTILALHDGNEVDHKALYRKYHSRGLKQLVVIHRVINEKIRMMSPLDDAIESALAAFLQFEEFKRKNHCAHVLTFGENEHT